jgi:hypothetical protein
MAGTPEGKIKAQVKKVLAAYGVYWHMPVMNGMGAPSLDFVCCHHGKFLAIETKAGNKQMTDRQETTAATMRKAGAVVFLINAETGTGDLERWLKDY